MSQRARILATIAAVALLTTAAGAARMADKTVKIQKNAFSPAKVTVGKGDTVRWTNDDDRDHKVAAKDGSFSSGNLKPGDTFEHTFKKAGTFDYADEYRPRMKGTVVVE